MAGIGIVIVIAVIIGSMAFALYMYSEYQTNFLTVNAGEPVIVGPVEYLITFEGTNSGKKDTQPENTFVKIRIDAQNISQEITTISGGQFHLVDEKGKKHEAIYGGFSEEDLFIHNLEPGIATSWTTQFDVEYDDKKQYDIIIRPSKEQSTVDTAMICITNC